MTTGKLDDDFFAGDINLLSFPRLTRKLKIESSRGSSTEDDVVQQFRMHARICSLQLVPISGD